MRVRFSNPFFSRDLDASCGMGWCVDVWHRPARDDEPAHELWSFPSKEEAEAEIARAKGATH